MARYGQGAANRFPSRVPLTCAILHPNAMPSNGRRKGELRLDAQCHASRLMHLFDLVLQLEGAMKKRLYQAITRGLACSALAVLSLSHAGAVSAQTAQPSYTWNNVRIVAGGYVDGIIAHPKQQGLFYARTDVGGAYRYDSASSKWIALNDWTPPADQAWTGIESIAIDPNNPNMLFLAAGLYVKSWAGNGAILVSSDQGKSFTAYPLSFREIGRA